MSLLPTDATFEERVQDCFLAFRGSGLMLSTLDVELLERWSSAHVPFEIVARGIRKAAESAMWDARADSPTLRSLRSCKRHVEAEIQKYLGHRLTAREADEQAMGGTLPEVSAGTDDEPAHVRRHKKMRAAVGKLGRHDARLGRGASQLLAGLLAREPASLLEADRQEEGVYLIFLRALPFSERVSLLREARGMAQNAGLTLSHQARKLSRRFHRAAVVRRHLSLPSFW